MSFDNLYRQKADLSQKRATLVKRLSIYDSTATERTYDQYALSKVEKEMADTDCKIAREMEIESSRRKYRG